MVFGQSTSCITRFGIHVYLDLTGRHSAAGGMVCLAAALNKSQVVHSAVGVLYTLVQEEVVGCQQANKNTMLLAGLQGLQRCSASLEPPINDSTCKQAIDAGKHCMMLIISCSICSTEVYA